MSNEILAAVLTTLTILGIMELRITRLVKRLVQQYLYELRPNGGSSVKDKVDKIYDILNKKENEWIKQWLNRTLATLQVK